MVSLWKSENPLKQLTHFESSLVKKQFSQFLPQLTLVAHMFLNRKYPLLHSKHNDPSNPMQLEQFVAHGDAWEQYEIRLLL